MCEFSYVLRLLEVFKLCFLHLNNCIKETKYRMSQKVVTIENPKQERLKKLHTYYTSKLNFNPTIYNLIINIFF